MVRSVYLVKAETLKDAEWMRKCSFAAEETIVGELKGTASERELFDMIYVALEKEKNGEQLSDGEKKILERYDKLLLENLRSSLPTSR